MPFRPATDEEIKSLSQPVGDTQRMTVTEVVPGLEKKKSPFTETQTKDANFAAQMELALKDIEKLDKDPEFDPTSFYNTVFVERFPFIPEFAENRFKTGKFQVYDRAMKAFTMAQLRKDTGATINSQEQELVNEIYVPVYGDSPETLQAKAEARRAAFETMKKAAGEAFTESPEAQQIRKTPVQNNAIENLREMVKRNPDLRDSRGRLVREELATLDQKIERQGIEIQ